MSKEDDGSKTEEATSKRREEAFKDGNFAKTPDIGVIFVLVAALIIIAFYAKTVARRVALFTEHFFDNIGQVDLNLSTATHYIGSWFQEMFFLIFPFIGSCFVAAILAGGLQSGFKLTPKVLGIKWDKLNPVNGAKNILSKKSLFRAAGDLFKFSAVGLVIYGALNEIVNSEIFGSPIPVGGIGDFMHSAFCLMIIRLILALGIIAALNYAYQRFKTSKDLRMSKQEVKDERKQQDGDPMVKSAMRAMARRLIQGQMLDDVPFADVVVTNPTHYAVALKYETGKDPAPIVLAKGENMFALRIKELAKDNNVPIVENKTVARILYRIGKVREEIPSNLYQLVAEILSEVYKSHKYYFHRLKSRRQEREKTGS